MREVGWTEGSWTREPTSLTFKDSCLLVEATEGSDWWRNTAYHFVHNDGHALLKDFCDKSAMEVTFSLNYRENFDQCGIFIKGDDSHWIKAGIEFSDGAPQIGAVVTVGNSDWSTSPCPEWFGKEVTIRVSRDDNAVTIRAKTDSSFHLVRVAPIDSKLSWQAGPYICAPSRSGLVGEFISWREGNADTSLH